MDKIFYNEKMGQWNFPPQLLAYFLLYTQNSDNYVLVMESLLTFEKRIEDHGMLKISVEHSMIN